MSKKQIEVGSKVWAFHSEVPWQIIAIGVTQYVIIQMKVNQTRNSDFYLIANKEDVFATKAEHRKRVVKTHAGVGDYVMCISSDEKHCGLVVKGAGVNLTVLLDEEPTTAYAFRKDANGLVRFPKRSAVVLVKATKK